MPDSPAQADRFFTQPILNSPYVQPTQHWELDASGQPTLQIIPKRRPASFVTPIPKPKKAKRRGQSELDRSKTISAFGGPAPTITVFDDQAEEQAAATAFLKERLEAGVKPHEMAIMVRDDAQLPRAQAIAQALGVPAVVLDQRLATLVGSLNLSTMHLAKGLEYRAVAVIACDDDVIPSPSPSRLAAVSDPGDLKEAYELERHLLYVACTRARDHLFVSGVHPASEFLTDLR